MRALCWGILAAALLGGCSRRLETELPNGAEAPGVERFYPLAVGNRWTYKARFLGEEREQIVELVRKNEEGFFVDNTGNALAVDSYGIRDERRYLLRAPLRRDAQWTNVVSVSSVEKYRILDVGIGCESPAGAFSGCVRVEGRSRVDAKTELINELTFAPDVGIVRIAVSVETGGQRVPQTVLELESFALVDGGKATPQTSPGGEAR